MRVARLWSAVVRTVGSLYGRAMRSVPPLPATRPVDDRVEARRRRRSMKTISIPSTPPRRESWKRFQPRADVVHSPAMTTKDSAASAVERFLDAVRGQRREEAEAVIAGHPRLAAEDLSVACAVGDEREVERRLAADPGAATRARGAERWPHLLYASASLWHERGGGAAEAPGRGARRGSAARPSPDTYALWQPDDDKSRLPALFFAAASGNVAVTRSLLEHGAQTNDGESIYHAVEFDRRECLELLLAHGADLSGRHSHWGNTPLFFNLGHREGAAGTERADRGIRWLLEHGADPEVTSGEQEETALHCAARVGRRPEIIALLIEHGARVARRRKDGATPYALALRYANLETAAALATHGAETRDVSAADRLLGACAAADDVSARGLLATTPDLIASLGAHAGEALGTLAERPLTAALRLALDLGFP